MSDIRDQQAKRAALRHPTGQLLGLAAVSGFMFALLALWARFDPVGQWETDIGLALALPDGPPGAFVRALNSVGDLVPWLIALSGLVAMALALRQQWAGLLIGLSALSDAVASLVKLLVERARPPDSLVESIFGTDSLAFPSGHVVRATTLLAVLGWLMLPVRLRLPGAILFGLVAGLLMGYARIALGVHWPSDVAGGLLLGLAWFGLTAALVRPPAGDHPGQA